MKIPTDVYRKIDSDFNVAERNKIKEIIGNLFDDYEGLGILLQAVRGLLYLSNGDMSKFQHYLEYDFRDMVQEAEEQAGNPGHWFSIPFEEMENFSGVLPESEEEEGDDFPF